MQIAVAASMASRGYDEEEIFALLYPATQAAAGKYGERWNWKREAKEIRRDIAKVKLKFPPKAGAKPEPIKPLPVSTSTAVTAPGSGAVKRTINPDNATHIKVGEAMINVIKDRGDAMIFMDKASWYYSDGLWTMDATDRPGWLKVGIEKSIMAGGFSSSQKLRSEVLSWI